MPDSLIEAAQPPGIFSVGSTLRQSSTQLFARLPAYLLLAMLPGVPDLLYSLILSQPMPDSLHAQRIISMTSLLALRPLAFGAIIHATFQNLCGRPAPLRESLSLVTPRFRTMLLVLLGSTSLIMLGSVLLLFPGIMLLTRYFVVIPVCLAEESGVGASLKRSAELTAGFRWKIFGVFLIPLLLASLLNAVMIAACTLLFFFADVNNLDELLVFLVGGVGLAYGAVLSAVTYHELRLAKEGVSDERIAAIFE